jgi:hypothetical protein
VVQENTILDPTEKEHAKGETYLGSVIKKKVEAGSNISLVRDRKLKNAKI